MTIRIPKWLLVGVLLLFIGGGAAVGGYFYGARDDSDLQDEAYDEGYAKGHSKGLKDLSTNRFDAEFREYEKGLRLGAKLALDPAYFDAGKAYVIRISENYPKGEPEEWNVSSLEMEDGRLYEPCGSTDICWVER